MNAVQIHPSDNVAVAIETIYEGETASAGALAVSVREDIPAGHKIALSDIPAGGALIKYGCPIGAASADIRQGGHVHSHNLKTGLSGTLTYAYEPKPAIVQTREPGFFRGFRRKNGQAGTRNELWIIPTVGCVGTVAARIAARAQFLVGGSLEGVYAFPHPYGCSQLGEDHENTQKALCGLINHPNAGAVLVLGLGCENNHIAGIKSRLGQIDSDRIRFLSCQEEAEENEVALALLRELAAYAKGFSREEIPMSELMVGLKCGGSDGFSGITANPLVGIFSDRLVAGGGSAILTEVPEMFGAEAVLLNRCVTREVFDKAAGMINNFKKYFAAHGQPVYENPSPGNKAGGITTLEEKSLGCTQKAGQAAVVDVLGYGEPARGKGLQLLSAPGNDLVASTALAVSGVQIILFTTGRGTPFGSPVPTVKIASNTALARHKSSWIDFDAGSIITGEPVEAAVDRLYGLVCAVASGETLTKAEEQGYRELAIFKNGVTM